MEGVRRGGVLGEQYEVQRSDGLFAEFQWNVVACAAKVCIRGGRGAGEDLGGAHAESGCGAGEKDSKSTRKASGVGESAAVGRVAVVVYGEVLHRGLLVAVTQ